MSILKISWLMLVVLGASCINDSTRTPSPIVEDTDNSVAILDIEGPGRFLGVPDRIHNFNRWSTFEKTKGKVHLFANEEARLRALAGVKHIVPREKLGHELAQTLATASP